MDFFKRAKVFRLKCGHQTKYLVADRDEETIRQSSNSSSTNAHWAVEPVEGKPNVVRFRSCVTYKYLATTDETFLTGRTGKKVAQRLRLDSTVEWEPIKEGQYLKLKSHAGSLLRANPGIPPWRNTVTHDYPGHWTATESMVNWIVDIVEIDYESSRGAKHTVDAPASSTDTGAKHTVDAPASSSDTVNQEEQLGHSSSGLKPNYKSDLKPEEFDLEDDTSNSSRLSRLSSAESMAALAVNVANITVKELNNLEFHVILSSGHITKLEKAISVIASNAKTSRRGNKDLANIEEKLRELIEDHTRASQELVEYTTFSSRRYEIRAELKQEVAKARELKALEAELKITLEAAKAQREELLKQLEETEDNIKNAEMSQAESKDEIDDLITRIQLKTEEFKIMEREQKSWEKRKYDAEKMLEELEEDWLQVKDIISDFW